MSQIQPSELDFLKAFRKRLRMARAASGVSNQTIADGLRMKPNTISGYFSGSSTLPSIGTLHTLCVLIDATLPDLVAKAAEDLELPKE